MPAPVNNKPRRPGPMMLLGAAATLVVLAVAGMFLYDRVNNDVIASGVRVDGVDVGGLSVSQARERLRQQLVAPLARPVLVRARGHTFEFKPSRAALGIDTGALADQALSDSRNGSIVSRVLREMGAQSVSADVPLQVGYSRASVQALVERVAQAADRPAVDASVSATAGGLDRVPGRKGLVVNVSRLRAAVERALVRPTLPRTIHAPLRVTYPKVTTAQLAAKYPSYIIVDRSAFKLRYYHHLRLADTYTIAVGMQGLETPAGPYTVQDKQVDPSWHVPNSSWAGSLAGTTVPPGAGDPLKARWMGIANGAGIHGTDALGSLGTAASHGCIRMSIPDVIALYDKVSVGTPVYIA